jgi:dolichol kinase
MFNVVLASLLVIIYCEFLRSHFKERQKELRNHYWFLIILNLIFLIIFTSPGNLVAFIIVLFYLLVIINKKEVKNQN